jgi:acid phosphatase family membrane protein YuiD
MEWLKDLFSNPFAMTALSSWLLAQIIKTLIHLAQYKKFDIRRIFGDGGMPSGHSATVSSLTVFTGMARGFASFEFAISFVLMIIVCNDATGVRRETEKQARLINSLVESFKSLSGKKLPQITLKEFVGHTPVQVLAGVTLGILNALFMRHVVFTGAI